MKKETKAERAERINEAADSLQCNAVDTVKDNCRGWAEMSELDWANAVYAEKVSQLDGFADQYRITPAELAAALRLHIEEAGR